MQINNEETYNSKEAGKAYSVEKLRPIEKKIIDEYIQGRTLDLGCGAGRTTYYIHLKEKKVIGVDISEELIKIAKKKYPKIKFEKGDACKMRFRDKFFDTVYFSWNGLDYIHPENKRNQAIREIRRVLKPNGRFIFSAHNPKGILKKPRPKFIIRNMLKGKLFSRYKIEKLKIGLLQTHYMTPKKQISTLLKNHGFTFERIFNPESLHPHYIFRKL